MTAAFAELLRKRDAAVVALAAMQRAPGSAAAAAAAAAFLGATEQGRQHQQQGGERSWDGPRQAVEGQPGVGLERISDGSDSSHDSSGGSGGLAPERVLPPAGGTYPSASGAIVSMHQLPQPSAWDHTWDARARRLRTLDVLLLHKQWLQWCALRLPAAALERNNHYHDLQRRLSLTSQQPPEVVVGCEASETSASASASAGAQQPVGPVERQLADIYSRYLTFTTRIMRLAPEAWNESTRYDLDTLSPLAEAPDQRYLMDLMQAVAPDALPKILQVRTRFAEAAQGLQAEEARLRPRREQLKLQQRVCRFGVGLPTAGVEPSTSCVSSGSCGADSPLLERGVSRLQDDAERSAFARSSASSTETSALDEPPALGGASTVGCGAPASGGPGAATAAEGSGGAASSTGDSLPATEEDSVAAELADIRERLRANAREQRVLASESLQASAYAIPIEQFMKVKVAMYPLAANLTVDKLAVDR